MALIIETDRLRIRRFEEKDAEGFFAYLSAPRTNCFMDEKLHNINEAKKEVLRRSQDEWQYAVCLKENDCIIGNLFAEKENSDTFNIGWHFNRQYEGKGFAYESTKAFFNILFMRMGARRIYCYVEEDNFRSQKLCEHLNMRKEGIFIDFISFINNEDGTSIYENTCVYALLKREWVRNIKCNRVLEFTHFVL